MNHRVVVRIKQTRKERLQQIINQWLKLNPGSLIDMRKVYRWAVSEGLYDPPNFDPEKIGAKEFSRAAREEYYTDPQGRRARRKHCARFNVDGSTQLFLWADIADAKPEYMHVALSQRRASALGDVKQLKVDLDSYNDNNPHGAHIQMSFNFDEDLAEATESTEYPDAPPDET